MSEAEIIQPKAAVATVDKRRRLPLIWAIPIITLLIAAWLVWDTYSKRGPTITITFDGAEGLTAGQSQVKYKDLQMGLVKSMDLTKDRQHVVVTVATNKEAESLLTSGAQFWVVKPRFFAGSISGLSTLLSGSYIGLLPGAPAGRAERHFTGLEDPPVLQSAVPGHSFLLKADRIGSINVGSPVFYHDIAVGEILGWDYGDMAQSVTIHAFVRAPFDKYVHDETKFWNASGLSVKLGSEGVHVQVESLKALLLGGVAFETPEVDQASSMSAQNQTFPLYADREAADQAGFRRKIPFLAYFQGSVRGLNPGSPVTFDGLQVGHVTSVELEYDPQSDSIRAPVRFEVQPERVSNIHLAEGRGPVANTRMLVQRGLRAQLDTANLLTGQKLVSLDVMPNAQPAELGMDGATLVMPTVPGTFAGLTDTVHDLLAKVNGMPFEKIGQNLDDLLHGTNDLVNSPQLKESLQSMQLMMANLQLLVKRLDTDTAPALKRLPAMATSLQETLTNTNKLLGSLDTSYGEDSRFRREMDRLLVQTNDMARSLRALAD
ncbi:MAG: MCE family protein, partial [Acetobacteraceae bacterium]|nr:MCE family protein [Acetobacteraceae bacterium]